MPRDERRTQTTAAKAQWFTTTHWSVVLAAGQGSSDSAAALEKLCSAYWYPLYAHVRRKGHGPHDAQDLTQEFFARLLEKNYLGTVGPEKGKFRSFLLASLNHFLSNERDRAGAAKRGGGMPLICLDDETAEGRYHLEPASDAPPDEAFEKRWAMTVLQQAMERTREEFVKEGKQQTFERLKEFLADEARPGGYTAVAAELGMSTNAVAVAVHRLRHRYREMVRAEIAQTVAGPEQLEEEMEHLLRALSR